MKVKVRVRKPVWEKLKGKVRGSRPMT